MPESSKTFFQREGLEEHKISVEEVKNCLLKLKQYEKHETSYLLKKAMILMIDSLAKF